MPVTETVMALGDWSLQLSNLTPASVLNQIDTPFGQIVITRSRLLTAAPSDTLILTNALYSGACLRPGPQRELGGCSLAWYLGDDNGGNGVLESGISFAASTSLSTAVGSLLTSTAFTSGTISAGTLDAWSTGFTTRRDVLNTLARWFGYEWRIKPARTIDVGTAATIYGLSPTGVITRRPTGREVGARRGLMGSVGSTWDWEFYGSKAYVWSQVGSGSSGGASTYRDPAGNLMTIIRGFEYADAPLGSESDIAAWWLSQINRSVRTVSVSTTDYAVSGVVPCGGSIYLYDRELGLYDTANQVQFGGGIIWPVSARVVSITWPIERGMGVYFRTHNGSAASYTDLTDWVEWENPGTQFEVSTGAQQLAPPPQAPPLSAFFSPWQTYAAEWRGTGSNPAINDGTIVGRFRRLGTRVEINVTVTCGSATTYGSGSYVVTMPPNCTGRTVTNGTQNGHLTMALGGSTYPGNVQLLSGGTDMFLIHATSPQANATPTVPATWANGDRFTITAEFEIDP